MEIATITLGPELFNWSADTWRDFYFRIADEAPVSDVYIGETICSKRGPLFAEQLPEVVERLQSAGKNVVFSTLSEVAIEKDRQMVAGVCAQDAIVEANDASALRHLRGRAHHVGPYVNVYNERTLSFLAAAGARNFCVPPELPAAALLALCAGAREVGASIEVLAFGRIPLALSARCYHARAHGRTKDSCQFVCEEDPDGLELRTLDGQSFLSVNGIQTLSHEYGNAAHELMPLRAMGVSRFRLSPHSCDMVKVASTFRAALDGAIDGAEATARLAALNLTASFCNGFYHGKAGHIWTHAS